VGRSFFPFVTVHTFDRQTDGQKGLGNIVCCITCKSHGKNSKIQLNPGVWSLQRPGFGSELELESPFCTYVVVH